MNDFTVLKKAVEDAAKAAGVSDYELYYSESSDLSAETYRDEISAMTNSVGGTLFCRCLVGGKLGYASTKLFTEDEMSALVNRAAENAAVIEKEEEAILFAGAKPEEYRPILQSHFVLPSAKEIQTAAMDCRNTLYAADKLIADGTECGASAVASRTILFNSKGLYLENTAGIAEAYMYAVLDNGKEKVFDYDTVVLDSQLDDTARKALAEKVVAGANAKFDATRPKTGHYPIVFDSKQMSAILSAFISVFYAENAQKGLSLLRGKTGEKIAADCVNITDTSFYPTNPLQINFDDEGVPTREKKVIENGVLKTLLYNLVSAKKDGVKTTGNASRSGSSIGTSNYWFYIESGKATLDELFAKAGNGIYVTEMKGFHAGADAVTGDFSIESAGFFITDGKKGSPIKSFTIAGNFFDFLKRIDTLGEHIDFRTPAFHRIAAPDTLIFDLSVAGE